MSVCSCYVFYSYRVVRWLPGDQQDVYLRGAQGVVVLDQWHESTDSANHVYNGTPRTVRGLSEKKQDWVCWVKEGQVDCIYYHLSLCLLVLTYSLANSIP